MFTGNMKPSLRREAEATQNASQYTLEFATLRRRQNQKITQRSEPSSDFETRFVRAAQVLQA
jgi:hypothetical protein